MTTETYCFGRDLELPFGHVEKKLREALQEEGFGILTEIDVEAKLREKLGEAFRPYKILGACNPKLAHQALSAEIDLGTLLPCNVILYRSDGGGTAVRAMDPVNALGMVDNPALREIAKEVRERIGRALDTL